MNKNRKGQMGGKEIGGLILVAIAVIVGVIMLQASAQQIDTVTSRSTVANESTSAVNGTTAYLTNYKSCTDFILFNATGDVTIPASNYTVTYNVINPSTGLPAVSLLIWVGHTESDSGYAAPGSTFDGSCESLTYDSSSGGRAIAGIILIFFALAIATVALLPALRNYDWR